jgi:hypothetical protein
LELTTVFAFSRDFPLMLDEAFAYKPSKIIRSEAQ